MNINWKLPDYLKQNNVSVYKLDKELSGRVSTRTLYSWGKNAPERPDLGVLGEVIGALRRLTGQPVTPNDLLEVIEEPVEETIPEKAWLDSSAADLLERLEEIEKDVPKEEVQAWLESFQKSGTPIKYDPDTRSFIGGAK